jgi:hypothetical protein
LLIAETQDAIALGSQPLIALSVMQLCFRQIMPPAVRLDDQLGVMDGEIRDVSADRSLSPDVQV